MKAPSNSLQFKPLEKDSELGNLYMQLYQSNGSAEILVDTMEKVFREGDRIIQTKNNEAVSNGDVGVIERIYKDDEGDVQVDIKLFDGRAVTYSEDLMDDVDWSYCITIHKSQGTEVPTAIIPLMKEHYIMLRRNLLYTAISRAKEKVILIGQRQAVYMAIHRSDVDKRNTVFADRIVAYLNREVQKRAC